MEFGGDPLKDAEVVGKMGEGTFSEVLKCQSHVDGKLYACKKMKQKYDTADQVNNLREIQALRRLNPHPNIIELKEIIFDKPSGQLSLICELMDMNIYELIKDRKSFLPEPKVRLFMYQLCKSIYHMHRNGIFHRDVKPENILVKENVLKLADFGSCKSVYSQQPYTEYISTRWYRAPECLLTDGHYTHKMDMWSVGCVMFEVMTLRPLFPGSNELDQVHRIHDVVGSPSLALLQKFKKHQSRHMEFNFPVSGGSGIGSLLRHGSKGCVDLITHLCTYDPDTRLTAKQALRHPYFKDIREAERRAKVLLNSPPPMVGEVRASKLTPTTSHHSHASHQTTAASRHHRKYQQKHRNKPQRSQQLVPVVEASPHGLVPISHQLPLQDQRVGPASQRSSGSFLPAIHNKPQYMTSAAAAGHSHAPSNYHSHAPSGYTSLAPSNKSTARGSFLPSIYGDKYSAKHALYSGVLTKPQHHHLPPAPHHKTHPSHLPAVTKHRTGAG